MLASAALPSGLGEASARTASSQGLQRETQKQLRQPTPQASLQPSVLVWEQADLDSIAVPSHCNLLDAVLKFLKQNFVGKEVLQHEKMQAGVQDVSQQKQLKAWKTELLQNAYEDLSVELGYQILVDSAQERVASEEAQRNVKLIPQ